MVHRIVGENKEVETWPGKICPKIKKKLDKFTEWSAKCLVKNALVVDSSKLQALNMKVDIGVDLKR
jgi:hypothetical protein